MRGFRGFRQGLPVTVMRQGMEGGHPIRIIVLVAPGERWPSRARWGRPAIADRQNVSRPVFRPWSNQPVMVRSSYRHRPRWDDGNCGFETTPEEDAPPCVVYRVSGDYGVVREAWLHSHWRWRPTRPPSRAAQYAGKFFSQAPRSRRRAGGWSGNAGCRPVLNCISPSGRSNKTWFCFDGHNSTGQKPPGLLLCRASLTSGVARWIQACSVSRYCCSPSTV